MPPAGFETEIPASDRPQALALHRSAIGISQCDIIAVYCGEIECFNIKFFCPLKKVYVFFNIASNRRIKNEVARIWKVETVA
jgi:hypothetical protein